MQLTWARPQLGQPPFWRHTPPQVPQQRYCSAPRLALHPPKPAAPHTYDTCGGGGGVWGGGEGGSAAPHTCDMVGVGVGGGGVQQLTHLGGGRGGGGGEVSAARTLMSSCAKRYMIVPCNNVLVHQFSWRNIVWCQWTWHRKNEQQPAACKH